MIVMIDGIYNLHLPALFHACLSAFLPSFFLSSFPIFLPFSLYFVLRSHSLPLIPPPSFSPSSHPPHRLPTITEGLAVLRGAFWKRCYITTGVVTVMATAVVVWKVVAAALVVAVVVVVMYSYLFGVCAACELCVCAHLCHV